MPGARKSQVARLDEQLEDFTKGGDPSNSPSFSRTNCADMVADWRVTGPKATAAEVLPPSKALSSDPEMLERVKFLTTQAPQVFYPFLKRLASMITAGGKDSRKLGARRRLPELVLRIEIAHEDQGTERVIKAEAMYRIARAEMRLPNDGEPTSQFLPGCSSN